MKKAAKKLLFLACFGGFAYLLGKLAQKDEVQEKLFEVRFVSAVTCSCGRSTL